MQSSLFKKGLRTIKRFDPLIVLSRRNLDHLLNFYYMATAPVDSGMSYHTWTLLRVQF